MIQPLSKPTLSEMLLLLFWTWPVVPHPAETPESAPR